MSQASSIRSLFAAQAPAVQTAFAQQQTQWRPLREILQNVETAGMPPQADLAQEQVARVRAEAKSAVAAAQTAYVAAVERLAAARQELLQDSVADLVSLSLQIASEVLMSDVAARRDFTERMVRHALKLFGEADNITLRMSPEDAQAVLQEHPELLKRPGVRVIEDATLTMGGVVAESALGRIDATTTTRLRDISKALLGDSAGSTKR